MFKKFFNKNKTPRHLTSPRDLLAGDMVEFKSRSILPIELQGASLTVKKVQAYQYSDGFYPEFVLESTSGSIVTMMCSREEEEDSIYLCRELSKSEVDKLFNSDELAQLWESSAAKISVKKDLILELRPWLAESYHQQIGSATAYFFDKDVRGKEDNINESQSERLQYHECDGSEQQYSLNVEIWEDGSTDFYVQINMPFSIIAELWPNAS